MCSIAIIVMHENSFLYYRLFFLYYFYVICLPFNVKGYHMPFIVVLLLACVSGALSYLLCTYTRLKMPFSSLSCALIVGLLVAILLYLGKKSESSMRTDESRMIVGVSADFPPFSFMQEGKIVGFDIDIIEEIARRMGKKIEFKNMPFGTLLPSLQLGSIDVIASGLTATPERAKKVLFTTPYLDDGPLVIVSNKKMPVLTIADLKGKEVTVNEGYTADQYISKIAGLVIMRLKSPAQAFLALKSGRAAAFVTAQSTVQPFFDEHGADQFQMSVIPDTAENSCLAVTPKNPALLAQIQKELDGMKDDGSLAALRTKWKL